MCILCQTFDDNFNMLDIRIEFDWYLSYLLCCQLSEAYAYIPKAVRLAAVSSWIWCNLVIFILWIECVVFWNFSYLLRPQQIVAMIAEMIHVASLVHDDVIDASNTRRGVPSIHNKWGQRKVTSKRNLHEHTCTVKRLYAWNEVHAVNCTSCTFMIDVKFMRLKSVRMH